MIENGMAKEEDISGFAVKISEQAKRLSDLINDIIKISEFDEKKAENYRITSHIITTSDLAHINSSFRYFENMISHNKHICVQPHLEFIYNNLSHESKTMKADSKFPKQLRDDINNKIKSTTASSLTLDQAPFNFEPYNPTNVEDQEELAKSSLILTNPNPDPSSFQDNPLKHPLIESLKKRIMNETPRTRIGMIHF